MKNKLNIGVLKETKTPPDHRVCITPEQATEIVQKFPHMTIYIQSSPIRCYADDEYRRAGIKVTDELSNCDILLGIKEVHIPTLIPDKAYLFFAHVGKKQPYNRKLLQEIIRLKIKLIDYEYLTDKNKNRIAAFGKWAGIVGAYNGLIGFGKRFGLYELKRAKDCFDFKEMLKQVDNVKLPPVKILVTGKGRVGNGAMETLARLKLKQVSPDNFLAKSYKEPVICQIDADVYTRHKNGIAFDFQHFFKNPHLYEGLFKPFTKVTDLYIACHYWDPKSPVFMTSDDYREKDFRIKVIADISCDIKMPIPSTLRPSTIIDPFYGYDPQTGMESDPWNDKNITVMAIDNLPGELPRDASEEFGRNLIDKVYPSLFVNDTEGIIERATIVQDGMLTGRFSYLQDYVKGK
ncbi:MAG: alanine dehydrogenase [Bacteroidia bacterium]|nr:alanine dehydrogenase [Bacteroidia bacterium]